MSPSTERSEARALRQPMVEQRAVVEAHEAGVISREAAIEQQFERAGVTADRDASLPPAHAPREAIRAERDHPFAVDVGAVQLDRFAVTSEVGDVLREVPGGRDVVGQAGTGVDMSASRAGAA